MAMRALALPARRCFCAIPNTERPRGAGGSAERQGEGAHAVHTRTHVQAQHIVDLAWPQMKRSTVVGPNNTDVLDDYRTSYGTFISRCERRSRRSGSRPCRPRICVGCSFSNLCTPHHAH
jgi:hypothetical protein